MEGDFHHLFNAIKVTLKPYFLGYCWIFPKGKHKANVGIGVLNPGESRLQGLNLREELQKFIRKENLNTPGYRILKKAGGAVPFKPCPSPVKDNIIVTGDAAGLASPLHGGGIDTACISGRIAVEVIDQGSPEQYSNKLSEVLAPKFALENNLLEVWKTHDWENLNFLASLVGHKDCLKPESLNNYSNQTIHQIKLLNNYFVNCPM